jgi:hypothetical protein
MVGRREKWKRKGQIGNERKKREKERAETTATNGCPGKVKTKMALSQNKKEKLKKKVK